jgi:galactosamine-6-phosphate isomerase
MNIEIYNNYELLSEATANAMALLIKEKSNAVICIASGDSPKLACELFCKKVKEENVDVSQFFFVGLDAITILKKD